MNKLIQFLCPPSNSLAECLKKMSFVVLIALVLLIGVRAIDGDQHRLGTLTIDVRNL